MFSIQFIDMKKTTCTIMRHYVVLKITARLSPPSIFKIERGLKNNVSQSALRAASLCCLSSHRFNNAAFNGSECCELKTLHHGWLASSLFAF